jgi:hypothetical protein
MMEAVKIQGLKEVKRLLRDLGPAADQRVIRAATAAGARVVQRALVAAAPTGTGRRSAASRKYGRLRENIRSRMSKGRRVPGRVRMVVSTGDAFWGVFHEYGTGTYYSGRGGQSKGAGAKRHLKPRPWFLPGVDSSWRQAVAANHDALARGVRREVRRLAKGAR